MKKINFKQPKYIFPLLILLPLLFLVYQITSLFGGSEEPQAGVVTDSINMSLPDAANNNMADKMTEMSRNFAGSDGYTAVSGLGQDEEAKDSTDSGYSDEEKDKLDAERAAKEAQQQELERINNNLAASRRRLGSSGGSSRGYSDGYSSGSSTSSSRRDELEEYAKELDRIHARSREREKALYGGDTDESTASSKNGQKGKGGKGATENGEGAQKVEEKAEIVTKVPDVNAEKFNTVGVQEEVDAALIKAMIDQTTKVHEGTRLRFKLLDDVIIKGTLLKKGTYLYGLVSGFGQQRVMANVTSVIINDKFIKVNLSVFDNDGMQGFYVTESAFRSMMKEAGASAMSYNLQLDNGSTGELTGESIALQALQNVYQSASSAVAANIRKNKARIKYNTIVYLVNTQINNR